AEARIFYDDRPLLDVPPSVTVDTDGHYIVFSGIKRRYDRRRRTERNVMLARPPAVKDPNGQHRYRPASRKALCINLVASSAYMSSMTQEMPISEVDIISMLMFCSDKTWNILPATPYEE